MNKRRTERGAVAVVFALSALLIFGLAAIGVDLGNAMNRKKLTQNAADFAALAGANGLPSQGVATIQAVADYLNSNRTDSDGTDRCDPSSGPVTVADLTDGSLANGEVTFPTAQTIKVVTPSAKVSFGLANAIGFSSTCVQGVATAHIASGGFGMAPYYATSACSSGIETLKDNSGGLSIPFTVPVLSHDAETNTSVLSAVNPTSIPLANLGDPPGPNVTVTGTHMDAGTIDQVGFFNADGSEPVVANPSAQTNTTATVAVPNAVASYQDVWWIRVHNKNTGKWSDRTQAQGLQVGVAKLSCDAGPSSGNFGSIDIPWGGTDSQDLVKNIQMGLRPPTTLAIFPNPLPADNACDNDPRGVISTDTLSKPNTNCVQSVTGLNAPDAYDGYLGTGGRLVKDTSADCQALGRASRSPSLGINDDLLSCFLADDTLRISDTLYYTGTQALFKQSIWSSPRLVLVPLLNHDPNGTKWMPITGFAVGFITDQSTGASRTNPLVGTDTNNGLIVQSGRKLRAIRVIFFSLDALPPPPDGVPLQDYIGSGKKLVTLIN